MDSNTFKTNNSQDPVKIPANTPQFFFDDSLIAHHEKLTRRWMQAKIFPKPLVEPDKPWEGCFTCLFGTVVPGSNEGYRMYYSNYVNGFQNVLLATSQDGFRWEKPELGLIEWKGSKQNNIVLAPDLKMDSPSIIFDPDDPEYPYKMITFQRSILVAGRGPGEDRGLYGYRSRDGINWDKYPGILLKAGDRTNIMPTKPGGKFVIYTRGLGMMESEGRRVIYRSESEDFLNWSEPQVVLKPDLADEPDVEFYGMSVFERFGWYFGLLEYWHSATDLMEIHLVLSRDGKKWIRPMPRAPFIAAAYDWNRKWNSCASNGAVFINEQMVFYFGGRWVSHNWDSAHQYGAVGFASLPFDRFCALEATTGGLMATVPIVWPGGDLILNADTRESFESHPSYCNGEIGVEILDPDGQPLPGWSGENRAVFQGNTHRRNKYNPGIIRWAGDKGLDELKGRAIRLCFHLRHARMFTFEAGA
ncbi:MAG: hypothetical protein GX754_02040 [Clostridiaceae bacterium]|nr:hypothetical protein [Clostridiaceae bacterium]